METKDLLKKVRKIEIKTRRLTNNIFGGEYHSAFKGRGMTFSEVRNYQFGDDVRTIDWNVTARYNEPFVKVFEEERELTLMLLVDVSGSEFFGTDKVLKKNIVTEISATLAFSALQNNDKVGLILFSDEVELYIPPSKGKTHVLRIIRELIEFKPKSKKTDISEALQFLIGVIKKKSIAFILSDFISENYEKTLKICAKKHDLTGIRIFDKMEESIPNMGIISMFDQETEEVKMIDTSSHSLRKKYELFNKVNSKRFNQVFSKHGAGTLNCRTDESYVKKLLSYFKTRG
ncbi:MAG: DUF58 domain-containing protein [Flavobacteriaceae bacterium]|nr:DUF58 domain-containing protein [Flavobacteriaceae bacterium]MDC0388936.1 DUF58 domain-containing protein [Flavobacteriaceae bacterium]MDG1052226.1 DUF58 domain-containing protein [Flavobacteriaceae bacterium]MDG1974118.1 DUF58 domain-containing protein [Flavobacteriaceae bacterium]MDG2368169.1 DUF58 domain-containing protein [Flavobacteriaceae bacterium]